MDRKDKKYLMYHVLFAAGLNAELMTGAPAAILYLEVSLGMEVTHPGVLYQLWTNHL